MCRNTTRLCALAPDRRVVSSAGRPPLRHPSRCQSHRRARRQRLPTVCMNSWVLALGIVDDCYGRRNDRCQLRGLARMIHTQFNHRRTVVFSFPTRSAANQYHCSDCRARGQIGVVKCRTHDCGQHFFHRGFAVAARHHSHWHVKPGAPAFRQILGLMRVVHHDVRNRKAFGTRSANTAATCPAVISAKSRVHRNALAFKRNQ